MRRTLSILTVLGLVLCFGLLPGCSKSSDSADGADGAGGDGGNSSSTSTTTDAG